MNIHGAVVSDVPFLDLLDDDDVNDVTCIAQQQLHFLQCQQLHFLSLSI